MAEFEGYLIKSGNTNAVFPHKYIKLETYKATPNQREEIEAYRDDYTRDLTRVTAVGKKSKVEFSTLEGLNLAQKKEIQAFFNACMTDTSQRKVYLKCWNDETNEYFTSYFYIPDVEYPIREIKGHDITYNSLIYKLVEY